MLKDLKPGARQVTAFAERPAEHPAEQPAAQMVDSTEAERMSAEIDRLYRALGDSQTALLTSNEHGDLLQDHLYRLNSSLAAEVKERQAAEEKLRRLLHALTKEKADLEVLVQILVDQGDILAVEGEEARIDSLTNIPNRRGLDECLLKEWVHHGRLQQPLSMLLCDVDHFKLFNDSYGHQAGDECLRQVASAISKCLRADDLAARYGGEEFAIVLPHTPRYRAEQIAERVIASLAALAIPHAASPVKDQITLSIGVACQIPVLRLRNADALVGEADRNLYLAKYRGRNCSVSMEK